MIVEVTQPDTLLHATANGGEAARRLKEVTGQVLGSVFFGTLLRLMRDAELKGGYGHGGRAETVFAARLHEIYAQRLGTTFQTQLGEAIYRSLEPQQRRISERRTAARKGEDQATAAATPLPSEKRR